MPVYDPGDCAYAPNILRSDNKQVLGDAIIQLPKGGAHGAVLSTARMYGPDPTGIYRKYHKRNHTDFFYVNISTSG